MTTLSATEARKEFFHLVNDAAEEHQTFRIQHRKHSAVLLSEDDYDGLMETLELLSVQGFRESIRRSVNQVARGKTVSMDEALHV